MTEPHRNEHAARRMIARFVNCGAADDPREEATDSSGRYMANSRVLLVVLAAISGCTAQAPLTDALTVTADEWSAARQVKLLAPCDVTPEGTLTLGETSALSCAYRTTDRAATREGTLQYLQVLAYRAGASAIINVACGPLGIYPLGKNCWSAVSCKGIAVRVPD